MKQNFGTKQFFMMTVALIAALMLQLVTPLTAFADDGTNPAPSEEQAASADTITSTDETTTTPGEQVVSEVVVETIVESLPENVELVVVGTDGEPEPLASQDAADAIANSDPFWCPEGTTPNGGGCTSYATFTALLGGLQGVSTLTNGTVYVQAGNYGGPESQVVFDGNILTNIGNLNLIGGWNLLSGPYSQIGTTVFDIPVAIVNWMHDVSVEDIEVIGATGSGLTIQTTGKATVTDVVTDNNTSNGVYVIAGDSIALTNVQANSNGDDGVDLRGTTNTGSITLTNVQANNNVDDGIYIYTKEKSNITLSGVTADNNGGDGLQLENPNEDVSCTFTEQFIPSGSFGTVAWGAGVKLVNGPTLVVTETCAHSSQVTGISNSEFNNNGGNGIFANATGTFVFGLTGSTISPISTSGNGANGIELNYFDNHDPFPWDYYQELANTLNGGAPAQLIASLTPNSIQPFIIGSLTSNDNTGYGMTQDGPTRDFYCLPIYFEHLGNGLGTDGIEQNPGGISCVAPPSVIPVLGGETIDLSFNGENDSIPTGTISTTTTTETGTSSDSNKGNSEGGSKPICEQNSIVTLQLPNNDNVTVFCPISGQIGVKSIRSKGLPGAAPDGVTFVSSLEVNLFNHGAPVPVITEGGHLKVSFAIPSDLAGQNFVIMYWDAAAGQWVELPAFADNNGQAVVTDLGDGKLVLEGTKVLSDVGFVEASVNFPGTFMLIVK